MQFFSPSFVQNGINIENTKVVARGKFRGRPRHTVLSPPFERELGVGVVLEAPLCGCGSLDQRGVQVDRRRQAFGSSDPNQHLNP